MKRPSIQQSRRKEPAESTGSEKKHNFRGPYYYSYEDNLYFWLQHPDLIINTSIDLVILSFIFPDIPSMHQKLNQYFELIAVKDLRNGKFDQISQFTYGDTARVDLLYNRQPGRFFNRSMLKLYQPTRELVYLLSHIFRNLSITPSINKIELAWDFYGVTRIPFQQALEKQLLIKYQRSPSYKYGNTFYTNNIRRSVKGIRVYPKELNGHKIVRMELELHQRKIKTLGIVFPFETIHINFRDYFEFKRIDCEKLYNYRAKKSRKRIAEKNWKRPRYGGLILRQIGGQIGWLQLRPLMEAVEHLKLIKLSNYNRFLVPMEEANDWLQEITDQQKFRLP